MTLRIEITVPEEAVASGKADRYVSTALASIGYSRRADAAPRMITAHNPGMYAPYGATTLPEGEGSEHASTEDDVSGKGEATTSEAAPQVRLLGRPGDGRKRRTNAEIAEDDALIAAGRAAGYEPGYFDHLLTIGNTRDYLLAQLSVMETDKSAQEETPQISTGENRTGPEDDTPEIAAQDAADEAAERAASRTDGELTHIDLNEVVGQYQKKYGIEAAIADTSVILGCNIPDVPKADLAEAIAKVKAAIETGRPGSTASPEPDVTPATRGEVGAALMEYARKFDGENIDPQDISTYPFTNEDGGKVFGMLFGADVKKLSQVPNDPVSYGRALAGIRELLAKNPFKREAK